MHSTSCDDGINNPSFDPAKGYLNIPLVESLIVGGKACYEAGMSLTSTKPVYIFSLAKLEGTTCDSLADDTTSTSFNKQQTQRLQGTWTFTYTFIDTLFTNTYTLSQVEEDSDVPGDYAIFGSDTYGEEDVIATYDSELETFGLLDLDTLISQFYVFDFTSDDTVEGCLFLLDNATEDISDCYAMTGNRTRY